LSSASQPLRERDPEKECLGLLADDAHIRKASAAPPRYRNCGAAAGDVPRHKLVHWRGLGHGRSGGRLSSVSNSVSTRYYFYNKLGQTQCSRQSVSGASYDFAYTTTPQGEWRNEVYPSGRAVARLFNARVLPMSVGNYATSIMYWPHGAVNQLTLGNSVVETTSYSSRLQPDFIQTMKGTTSELWKLQNFYCGGEGSISAPIAKVRLK
jgi:hypothetical protein